MDEATASAARFIVVCTIAIAVAEFLTRREGATVRWIILASIWVVIVAILFWTIGAG